MKKLFLLLILVLIAVFTNPPLEKHQAAVKSNLLDSEKIDENIDGDDLLRIGALLGDALGLNTVEKYLNNNVKIKDLKVCSLTQLQIKDDYKTIGIGIFGNVFLFDNIKDLIVK